MPYWHQSFKDYKNLIMSATLYRLGATTPDSKYAN